MNLNKISIKEFDSLFSNLHTLITNIDYRNPSTKNILDNLIIFKDLKDKENKKKYEKYFYEMIYSSKEINNTKLCYEYSKYFLIWFNEETFNYSNELNVKLLFNYFIDYYFIWYDPNKVKINLDLICYCFLTDIRKKKYLNIFYNKELEYKILVNEYSNVNYLYIKYPYYDKEDVSTKAAYNLMFPYKQIKESNKLIYLENLGITYENFAKYLSFNYHTLLNVNIKLEAYAVLSYFDKKTISFIISLYRNNNKYPVLAHPEFTKDLCKYFSELFVEWFSPEMLTKTSIKYFEKHCLDFQKVWKPIYSYKILNGEIK